ncbi:phospholipase [Streptomyces sioyaensis]|uniref:luciferase domain-containing protein n=1 Tax=Streptomyces sioyaensis TaxID=67364 RepID=UPI0037CDE567
MTFVIDPAAPQLPHRGAPPLVTAPSPGHAFPHQQLTQNAPPSLQEELYARAAALPGVRVADSYVSVPGSRAFHLDPDLANGPADAYQSETEFAHLHPAGDGSLHMTLPPAVYHEAQEKEWGQPHPISGTMLVFGPRDTVELEIVWQMLLTSYRFAVGEWLTAAAE